jgi:hypothetical protein
MLLGCHCWGPLIACNNLKVECIVFQSVGLLVNKHANKLDQVHYCRTNNLCKGIAIGVHLWQDDVRSATIQPYFVLSESSKGGVHLHNPPIHCKPKITTMPICACPIEPR